MKYVLCKCEVCGWTDGFREDVASQEVLEGYCDRCATDQPFELVVEDFGHLTTAQDKGE